MAEKKSFFAERKAKEISRMHTSQVYHPKNLVKRILDLNPSVDALELRFEITPGEFRRNTKNSLEASRKCYKHGDLIALSQPQTQQDAYSCPGIPLAIRARDFSKLGGMKEEEINFVGYSWHPVQGRDRRRRVVPFVWPPEALKLFAYSETMTFYEEERIRKKGIQVLPYADAKKVAKEGAVIICRVPSRTKKKPRYEIRLQNVPVIGVTERRAVIWSLKSDFKIDPGHSKWNFRYTWEHDREGSDRFTFYPHDIAAYIAVAGNSWRQHNLTPMEMNPFSLFSKLGAEFYKKLCNNILIFDPTIQSKQKLRKLHLDEKSIMLARAIGILGHDEMAYWDPARDGKLKDYNWSFS